MQSARAFLASFAWSRVQRQPSRGSQSCGETAVKTTFDMIWTLMCFWSHILANHHFRVQPNGASLLIDRWPAQRLLAQALVPLELSNMPANRMAGRPKRDKVEILDIKSIHLEWDQCEEIRNRLRDGIHLLTLPDGKNGEEIPSVTCSLHVLQPFITRTSLLETRPMPSIDALRDEVEAIYLRNKRGQTPEDQPDVIGMSWKIRKMLTFLKMKVRREEVSSAPCLIYFDWGARSAMK